MNSPMKVFPLSLASISVPEEERVLFRHPVIVLFVVCLYASFLTVSWDRCQLRFAESTFRASQMFMMVCFMIWFLQSVERRNFSMRVSGLVEYPLLLFTLWSLTTDVTSHDLKRSILYSFFLLFNLSMVFLVVNYVGESRRRLVQVMRVYFFGFVLSSLVGMAIMALMGAGLYNIRDENGTIVEIAHPRLYAMNYEPSYFATYTITFLVLILFLRFWGKPALQAFGCKSWHFWTVVLAFILTVSRGGFVILIGFLTVMAAIELYEAFALRRGYFKKWVSWILLVFLAFSLLLGAVVATSGSLSKEMDIYLFAGLGVGKRAKGVHSVGPRLITTAMTVETGLRKPFMGVGMGGFGKYFLENFGSYGLARMWLIMTMADLFANRDMGINLRKPEPMCVTPEVFATTGVPGLILWLWFNFLIPSRLYKLSRRPELGEDMRAMLRGLAWGHVALFVIMHLNQNIMRPYYWLHIAMCCATYLVARSECGDVPRLPGETAGARDS